jgi:hypothetical protein
LFPSTDVLVNLAWHLGDMIKHKTETLLKASKEMYLEVTTSKTMHINVC